MRAGFWARLAAYMLDSVIVFAGLLVVRIALSGLSLILDGSVLDGEILFQYTLKDICLYLGKVVYFVGFTYCTGTTLGKKALNLCVVSTEGEKLTLFQVFYRETVGKFLSGFVINLGFLMVIVDKEKRTLHDILSDTRVVYMEALAESYQREEARRKAVKEISEELSEERKTEDMKGVDTADDVKPETFQEGTYVYRMVSPNEKGSSMRTESVVTQEATKEIEETNE